MTGFTNRLSNLPPGCTDREIEDVQEPPRADPILREIAAHLSAARGLTVDLLDAIIRAGQDHAEECAAEVLAVAQLASRVDSRLGQILSRLRDFGTSNEAREGVAWLELLALSTEWEGNS